MYHANQESSLLKRLCGCLHGHAHACWHENLVCLIDHRDENKLDPIDLRFNKLPQGYVGARPTSLPRQHYTEGIYTSPEQRAFYPAGNQLLF